MADSYRRLGCREVQVIPGRFYPGVWAYYDAGAPVTVHSYCMFDTRTVNAKEWKYDPWGADLTPMGPYPKVLVGRGSMGAKGPYVAWLNALAAIIAVEGKLPVNIMFLAEGEEILGSPTYAEFVNRYADRLSSRRRQFRSGDVAEHRRLGDPRPRSERHGRHRIDRQRRLLGSRTGANDPLLDERSRLLTTLPPRRGLVLSGG